MLLDLRAENGGSRVEKVAWKSWATAFAGRQGRAASWLARLGLRAGGHLPGLPVGGSRPIPAANPPRDPAMLVPLESIEPEPERAAEPLPEDVVAAFRERASVVGAVVVDEAEPEDGDRRVRATAAVASTGSVLLTGDAAARGALMDSRRIIVEVDEASVVRFPQELGPALAGDGDALILTGASRTADIEKQIVRGIHGPEALVAVVGGSAG
ncbi:MAG: hypothetical protein OXH12_02355 [Chloroflexi bacterium]|nr:hypothetical protein [Chloroflexota bacterium]